MGGRRPCATKRSTPSARGSGSTITCSVQLKGVPRSHVYRLIRSGQVRVNSGRTSPSYRLQAGDRVRVPPVGTRPAAAAVATPDRLDWLGERIIYEDTRLLVIDKPAGLAVHGGSNVSLGCIEALRLLRPTSKDLELAHRLDRGTSGVSACWRNDAVPCGCCTSCCAKGKSTSAIWRS